MSYLYKHPGIVKRRKGSCRNLIVLTDDTINTVNELVLSQEDNPNAHLSQRGIAPQAGFLEVLCPESSKMNSVSNVSKNIGRQD